MGRSVFDFPFNPKIYEIMNTSKTSKTACVPASLKFAALAASILVPASAFAASEGVVPPAADSSSFLNSVAVKAFYAYALEAPDKSLDRYYDDPEIHLGGVTVEYTRELDSFVDFVAAMNIGGGSCDYERLGKGAVCTYEAEVGVNLKASLDNMLSVFVGPRIGVDFLYAEMEWDWAPTEDETKLGLLYGIDAGAAISFNDRHALTLGIGYRASTAEPLEMEKQSWVRFSVGYQYSF